MVLRLWGALGIVTFKPWLNMAYETMHGVQDNTRCSAQCRDGGKE